MGGSTNALLRFDRDPALYRDRIFNGDVLDIGGSADTIARARHVLTKITHVTVLDPQDCHDPGVDAHLPHDAMQIPARQWHCVYASHVLEHLDRPQAALRRWWQAVRPNGYLLIIVPDWRTYERRQWPPQYNTDHRTAWVMHHTGPERHLKGLLDLTLHLPGATLLHALTLDHGFEDGTWDQTADGTCESSLQITLWNHDPDANVST